MATDNRNHSKIFATDQTVGVAVDSFGPNRSIEFKPGTQVRAKLNNVLIYVYANEAIASGTGVELGASFTASASAGGELTSLYAMASGEYGWVYGPDSTDVANLLIEDGDNLLIESGDLLLLE